MKVLASGKITNTVSDRYLVAKIYKTQRYPVLPSPGSQWTRPHSPSVISLAGYSSVLSLGKEVVQQLCRVHGGVGAHGVSVGCGAT